MPKPNYIVGLAHVIFLVLYIVFLFQVSFLHHLSILKTFMLFYFLNAFWYFLDDLINMILKLNSKEFSHSSIQL